MSVRRYPVFVAAMLTILPALVARAEVKPNIEHIENGQATADFKFKTVPLPAKDDAAAKAKISIVEGEKDSNGADTEALNDGKLPTEEDQPEQNFFFNAGTEGGRLALDLGSAINIKQVNTYSWHPNTRGPQVYKLYASDGAGKDFNAAPKKGTEPEKAGWKLIATVDTRPHAAEGGGQYGVSIADPAGAALGKYQYLLFDMSRTESDDEFGNTFYSEIDVIEQK